MSEIAELISELNASAQIAYTSFRTYFKSSAPSSGGVRYRKTPIRGVRYLKTPGCLGVYVISRPRSVGLRYLKTPFRGVRYLKTPIRLWGCTLSQDPRPPPKSRRSKDLQVV